MWLQSSMKPKVSTPLFQLSVGSRQQTNRLALQTRNAILSVGRYAHNSEGLLHGRAAKCWRDRVSKMVTEEGQLFLQLSYSRMSRLSQTPRCIIQRSVFMRCAFAPHLAVVCLDLLEKQTRTLACFKQRDYTACKSKVRQSAKSAAFRLLSRRRRVVCSDWLQPSQLSKAHNFMVSVRHYCRLHEPAPSVGKK